MKRFCFTVDDNIRCLQELTEGSFDSIFDHPYLAMYRRLHEKHGLKVQLNLFYEAGGFDLSQVTDRYRAQWAENSHWLKLSFHSRLENEKPYEFSGYDEVFTDCGNVHRQIRRFASPAALGKTTTVHYCLATPQGLQALKDNGVQGLLGLYGTAERPRSSYQTNAADGDRIRAGGIVCDDGICCAGIDIVMNDCTREEILSRLQALSGRALVKVMIHEQYFYPDYPKYQPDFEEKLETAFTFLAKNSFASVFFEECL